jgi:hypothetical protein
VFQLVSSKRLMPKPNKKQRLRMRFVPCNCKSKKRGGILFPASFCYIGG